MEEGSPAADRYRQAFSKFGPSDGIVPWRGKRYLLVEGERPADETLPRLFAVLVGTFFVMNFLLLIRELGAAGRRGG